MPQYYSQKDFSQPFTQTLPHLQITFGTAEYLPFFEDFRAAKHRSDEFMLRLPNYPVARCPLCGASYHARIDTHSLRSLGRIPSNPPEYVYSPKHQTIGCSHFVAVTSFVNLNGVLPEEFSLWSCQMGDVPVITPAFLPDDLPAAAVIHSLPVCRIEDDAFVPRYSLYMITYFAGDPAEAWKRRRAEMDAIAATQAEDGNDEWHPVAYVYSSRTRRSIPEIGDLPLWVQRKKLYWLDLRSPDLPLCQAPAEDFPYAQIRGFGQYYVYSRNGNWPWDKWRYPHGRILSVDYSRL
jgi:hypothetical protein